jgi:hypothetical protein
MLKKMLVSSILFLTVVTLSNPAGAATISSCPDLSGGMYLIDGSLKLSVNLTNYVSATITLPKLGNLGDMAGEIFYFFPGGTLGDELLYSYLKLEYFGYWEQSGCNFAVDFTDLANMLIVMANQYGIEAEIAGPTTVTGKISSRDGTNSGKISLKINILSPIEGNLALSMSFKGYPVVYETLQKRGRPSLKPELQNFFSSVFSMISRKGATPKK